MRAARPSEGVCRRARKTGDASGEEHGERVRVRQHEPIVALGPQSRIVIDYRRAPGELRIAAGAGRGARASPARPSG